MDSNKPTTSVGWVYILATFPPLEGGEKIGTFGSLGKKIDPSEKKIQM